MISHGNQQSEPNKRDARISSSLVSQTLIDDLLSTREGQPSGHAAHYCDHGFVVVGRLSHSDIHSFLGWDLNLRRDIALHIGTGESEGAASITREAQVAGKLEHPSILPIYNLKRLSADSTVYSTRLTHGRTLSQAISKVDGSEINTLLNMFQKVCEAVDYAHSKSIVHGNLSCTNVLVGGHGEVVVTGWRNANELGPDDLAAGRVRDVKRLGGILYEILTLKAPVNDTPEPPILLWERNLPRRKGDLTRLGAVAMKAISCDAGGYASAGELAAEVAAYQDGFPVRAEALGFLGQVALFVKRNKRASVCLFSGVTLIATVVSLFGIWLASASREAARFESEAKQDADEALMMLGKARDRIDELRGVLPLLHEQVTNELAAGNLREALKLAELMTDLSPRDPENHVLKGNVLQCLGRIREAIVAYDLALSHEPSEKDARLNKQFSLEFLRRYADEFDWRAKACLKAEFYRQGRKDESRILADQIRNVQKTDWPSLKVKLEETGWKYTVLPMDEGIAIWINAPPRIEDLSPLEGSHLEALNLIGHRRLADLAPLSRLPLNRLKIERSNVSDLTPISGAPLANLQITHSPLASLAPVKGMRLTYLDVSGTDVRDLEPLRGMKITFADLSGTKVEDLTPLTGMPVKCLMLNSTSVHDLSPLAGCPIKTLRVGGTKVSDLRPLEGMSLTSLSIDHTLVTSLESLAPLPLESLYASGIPLKWAVGEDPLRFLAGKQIFMLHMNKVPITSIEILRGMPMAYLGLNGSKVSNLSALADAPLKQLSIAKTEVSSLEGLSLRQLTNLNIAHCPISDLRPVRGSLLETLDISYTCVGSLAPLSTLTSLRELKMDGAFVSDLRPLLNLKLRRISFTESSVKKGLELLRRIKTLQQIKTEKVKSWTPVSRYWREFDARTDL